MAALLQEEPHGDLGRGRSQTNGEEPKYRVKWKFDDDVEHSMVVELKFEDGGPKIESEGFYEPGIYQVKLSHGMGITRVTVKVKLAEEPREVRVRVVYLRPEIGNKNIPTYVLVVKKPNGEVVNSGAIEFPEILDKYEGPGNKEHVDDHAKALRIDDKRIEARPDAETGNPDAHHS